MNANGMIWWSTPSVTFGLIVKDGRVVDGPPYARKCGYVGRSAWTMWTAGQQSPHVTVEWLPDPVSPATPRSARPSPSRRARDTSS